jgi:hypothetical protein
MARFNIKVGDTAPDLQATLKNADGTVIDLSAASAVLFHMREKGSDTAKVERAAIIVAPASGGVVRYVWQTADTDTEGTYEGEFEITFNDGTISTVPNNGYIEIPMKTEIA